MKGVHEASKSKDQYQRKSSAPASEGESWDGLHHPDPTDVTVR